MGLDDASFTVGRGEFVFLVGSTGSGKSTRHAPAHQGARADLRDDPRRRARPGRDHAQEGPVLPAQPRRRLPGLQAAAQPHGARQRRLRAAGHRQLAQGGPREGARHPAPHRPVDQAAPLPRPALRRRAAARLGRARVRQPPAAAAGRRADRQPRSRDLDRDHAAAVPHQPHGDDGDRRHPRLGHGRPHAPARDRALARAHHPRRGLGPLRAARHVDRRVRRAAARARARRRSASASPATSSTRPSATDAHRLLPARGAALDVAQRRPELRGHGLGARHRARARRLHPGRPGDDRRGQRRPQPRARQRLPEDRRQAATTSPASSACSTTRSTTSARSSTSPRPTRSRSRRRATPRPTTCWAPTRCPTPSASRPTSPTTR